ncbi:MAG: thiol:disulfide interchange protein DsbA/DsbL [Gammaproteobacteria bacterium]
MKIHRLLCSALLLLAVVLPTHAEDVVAGKHYQEIKPAVPTSVAADKVEVVELFWYGCPHCYAFEPQLKEWLANKPDYVEFVRVPAVFAHNWEIHARAYYAAQQLGVLDKIHPLLFEAIHREGRKVFSLEEVQGFFADQGVPEAEFKKAYESFDVDTKARHAIALTRQYGITGVPAVIVNGKYRTSGQEAGDYATLLKVVETLADKEHKR